MSQELDAGTLTILILLGYVCWNFTRWMSNPPPADLKADPTRRGPALTLPGSLSESSAMQDDFRRWEPLVEPASEASDALASIRAADRSFDTRRFVRGAVAAYEAVLTAFAEGDTDALAALTSAEVHAAFAAAIAEREKQDERTEIALVRIDTVRIVGASLAGGSASVTVRFSSLFSTCRKSSAGVTVGNSMADLADEWTFSREIASRDPNWKLVATRPA